MRESCGKKHDYLGMDLHFLVDRDIRTTMINYLKKFISKFPETIHRRVHTLAAEHLFTVWYDTVRNLLDKYRATAFDHDIVQLLFATPQNKKDI